MKHNHIHYNGINTVKCFSVSVPAGPTSYTSEEVALILHSMSMSPATICKALSFEQRHNN